MRPCACGGLMAVWVMTSACCSAGDLPAAAPDLGGLTFDFAEISKRRFAPLLPADPANLARPDAECDKASYFGRLCWRWTGCGVQVGGIPSDSPIRSQSARHAKFTLKDDGGAVEKLPSLLDLCGGNERWAGGISGNFEKFVKLPDDAGGTYRFACRFRRRGGTYAGAYLQFYAWDGKQPPKGSDVRGDLVARPMSGDWAAWHDYASEVTVPKGANWVQVIMRHNGIGAFAFRDMTFSAKPPPAHPYHLSMLPIDSQDGRFFISEGQCGHLSFNWRGKVRAGDDFGKCVFELDLPAGYELLGTTFDREKSRRTEKRPDGSSHAVLALQAHRPLAGFSGTAPLNLLIGANSGAKEGTLSLVAKIGAEAITDRVTVRLVPVAPVRAAAVPKRYRNGFDCFYDLTFRSPRAYEALAKLFGDAGAGWLIEDSGNRALAPYWHKYAHGPYTPRIETLENGFRVGGVNNRPKADGYVAHNQRPTFSNYYGYATCPRTVIEERPFFLTNTVPEFARALEGADGAWANWEPWMFGGCGCMCTNCCRAFAEYAGVPYEEVARDWPDRLGEGSRWHDRLLKFRSREHGQLVKTVDRHIRALTGGARSEGMIPAICWIEMGSWWRPRNYAAEVQAIDYAGALEWMCPWGPYMFWNCNEPYAYSKHAQAKHWYAARDVRRTVDADYPPSARPKLMAYPQGRQCSYWVTQPEYLAMALDSFFFNRWEASCVYFFPAGYDARYWKRFAEATSRAARYEDYVLDGVPADDRTSATPASPYAVPCKDLSGYLPDLHDATLLPSAAFELNGRRIVAILNFWELGEAFADLRLAGLAKGDYTVVSEDGILWAPDAKRLHWSAEELAKGIRVLVGAVRTAVFEIRPATGARPCEATGVMTRKALDSLLEKRRPELEKRAAEDAETERRLGPAVRDGGAAA